VQSQWRQRNLTHAIATVDIALWHALGITTDQPLSRLLGSDPNPIPAMYIGGYYGEGSPREDVESAVDFVKSSGVAAVKLKVGNRDVDTDIEKLRLTRELGGDALEIVCDANGGWDLRSARRFADAAVEFGIEWLEEPIHWHSDVDGMRIMRANGKVQIGAGQSETSPQRAAKLIKDGVVDVMNFDASWGGGITGWRKVAGLAELSGVRVAHHSEPHLGMHLLAGIRERGYVEIYEPERDPIWYEMVDTPTVTNGAITAPYGPGIGLVVDESFVQRYRVT
jgi:L-alanine-DL-glutamate epimerase-like enolase superfamily enzyme